MKTIDLIRKQELLNKYYSSTTDKDRDYYGRELDKIGDENNLW